MIFLQNVMWWGWEKNTERETKTNKTKEKIRHLVALPSPFNDMEADCFQNAENKPDLY